MLDTTYKLVHNSLGNTLFCDLIDHMDKEKYVCLKKYFQHMTFGDLVFLYNKGFKTLLDSKITEEDDQIYWTLFREKILIPTTTEEKILYIHPLWTFVRVLYISKPGILNFITGNVNKWGKHGPLGKSPSDDKKLITEISFTATGGSKYDLDIFKRDALPYLTEKDFPNLVKLTVDGHNMLP